LRVSATRVFRKLEAYATNKPDNYFANGPNAVIMSDESLSRNQCQEHAPSIELARLERVGYHSSFILTDVSEKMADTVPG